MVTHQLNWQVIKEDDPVHGGAVPGARLLFIPIVLESGGYHIPTLSLFIILFCLITMVRAAKNRKIP